MGEFTNQRALAMAFLVAHLIPSLATIAHASWPQFRGPDGQGHAPNSHAPLNWSETENIRWKVAVPGRGWSSPVVSADQVWLSTAIEGHSLRAICIDRLNGRLVHNVELFRAEDDIPIHAHNSRATPTPVLDADHVFFHFGTFGTACLSSDGRRIWTNSTLHYNQPHGPASSPIVHGNLLILNCDGTDVQFVAALDKRTGDVVWKRPRQHLEGARAKAKAEPADREGFPLMAYSTPLVIEVDGRHQLVSTAADHVAAYDPATGEEIWWCAYDGFSVVARPVYRDNRLFVVGFEQQSVPVLYAIRPNQAGEVTLDDLAWRRERGVSFVPSPLLVGNELYMIEDAGVAICLDAATGQQNWQERIGGNFSASPVAVYNHIYLLSQDGKATVLEAGTQFRQLATNQLGGHFRASPAVVGNALYLRSETHLYCIEATNEPSPIGDDS